MSTLVLNEGLRMNSLADTALKAAARTWFLVAVVGQLLFSFTVATFYGSAAARANWSAWNRSMTHGYVPGQTAGNVVVGIHLLSAVLLTLGGAIQLVPQIRDRARAVHRWTGRIYVVTAFSASLAGLYMMWFRGTVGDMSQHLGMTLNAILILLCAVLTLRHALARRFEAHRRWALRLFLVVNGVWFFRIGLMLWLFLNHGPAGFDPKTFTGPFLTFLSFAQYLLPLAVLEWYLRAQRQSSAAGRIVMAASLFALTVATGIGIFMATLLMWLPALRNTNIHLG